MKRIFATFLLTLSGATFPLSARGQEPPVPPLIVSESQADDTSPDFGAAPMGEPTPLTPDGGAPLPLEVPAPAVQAPAPQSEPATRATVHKGRSRHPAPASESKPAAASHLPSDVGEADEASTASPDVSTDTNPDTGPVAKSGVKADDVPTEVVTERYSNRMVKIERHVTQDSERNFTNHGPWIMYASDGTLIAKGRYEFGQRQGEWQRLYDGKDERVVGKFAKPFSPPFIGIAHFTDGTLHGGWKIVDGQQREVRSWEFNHGKLDGRAVTYFPNGRKQSELTFVDGTLHGPSSEWDSSGKLIKKSEFKHGLSTTPYVKKYPNGGKHHDGHYLGPKQIVKIKADFWSGIVELQATKKEGSPKRHGKWTEYYESGGKKFEGDFDEDQPLGRHTWWYANGQKSAEGPFEGGKAHGQWVWWHENGLKQKDGRFDHGVQSGTWVHWKVDGKVQEVQEHSLATISPQQAKPLVNRTEVTREEQPAEALEQLPPATSQPVIRRLAPTPQPVIRRSAPTPQQRTQKSSRFRSR